MSHSNESLPINLGPELAQDIRVFGWQQKRELAASRLYVNEHMPADDQAKLKIRTELYAQMDPLGQQIVEHQEALTGLNDWLEEHDPQRTRVFEVKDGKFVFDKPTPQEIEGHKAFAKANGLDLQEQIERKDAYFARPKIVIAQNRLQGMLESLATNPRYKKDSPVTVGRTPKQEGGATVFENDWKVESVLASGNLRVVKVVRPGGFRRRETVLTKDVPLELLDTWNGHPVPTPKSIV